MLNNEAICAALANGVAIFENVPAAGLERSVGLARRMKLEKDAVLFHQGDAAGAFHLILAGRLRVGQTTAEGQQVIIRYLGPQEIAGCVAVCGGMPYPATATAVEDCWLLTWSRERIAELAGEYPVIALNAMRIMGGRVTEIQQRLREMQTERVERRIAHALGRLVVQAGRRTPEGVEIAFPLSRQDLAEMAGTTLHTVSRTLSAWEGAGIVLAGRQKVVIAKPHALVAIAEDLPGEPTQED
jgi:CRP-like cAMP-binding protein